MNLIKMDTHNILVHSFDACNDIHSLHVWAFPYKYVFKL